MSREGKKYRTAAWVTPGEVPSPALVDRLARELRRTHKTKKRKNSFDRTGQVHVLVNLEKHRPSSGLIDRPWYDANPFAEERANSKHVRKHNAMIGRAFATGS